MSAADDKYVCHLDAQSLERALKELNEVEKERDGAVQTLRDWVEQQSWLQSPTDTNFLLRFLRVRKFSQLGARQTLENYWTQRTKLPEFFKDASPDDPEILDVINSGLVLVMPELDDQGRRVIIYRPGSNLKELKSKYTKYTADVIVKAVFCVMDMVQMDEKMQVNGMVSITDSSGNDSEIADIFNIGVCRKVVPVYTKAFPLRIKAMHQYNMNVLAEAIFKIIRSTVLSEKMANRVHLHGRSLVSVYDVIEKRLLPKEYLPDEYKGPCAGTIADIIENMKTELCRPEVVSHIKDLNSGKYKVDLIQRKSEDVPAESFRKLNLD